MFNSLLYYIKSKHWSAVIMKQMLVQYKSVWKLQSKLSFISSERAPTNYSVYDTKFSISCSWKDLSKLDTNFFRGISAHFLSSSLR